MEYNDTNNLRLRDVMAGKEAEQKETTENEIPSTDDSKSTIPSYLFKTSYGANLLRLLSTNNRTFSNLSEEQEDIIKRELSLSGILGSTPAMFYDNPDYHRRLINILNERRKIASIFPISQSSNSISGSNHGEAGGSEDEEGDNDDEGNNGSEMSDEDIMDITPERKLYGDSGDEGGDAKIRDGKRKGGNGKDLFTFAFPTGWRQNKDFQVEMSSDGLQLSTNSLKRSYMKSNDGIIPSNNRSSPKYYSLKSNQPILKEVGIFYFEVEITFGLPATDISIGIMDCDKHSNQVVTNLRRGDTNSWAYNGREGRLCTFELAPNLINGIKFGIKDTIGCGVNFITSKIFYTKNGVYLGEAFDLPPNFKSLFAVISLTEWNSVITNFGGDSHKKFLFGIDAYVNSYKTKILKSINQVKLPKVTINAETQNQGDEDGSKNLLLKYLPKKKSKNGKITLSNKDFPDIVNSFVQSYFDHMGYADAGNALAKDLQLEREAYESESTSTFEKETDHHSEAMAVDSSSSSSFKSKDPVILANGGMTATSSTRDNPFLSEKEIKNAQQRKLIRELISENEFDKVISLLKSEFTDLITDHPRLIFKLQSLKLLDYIDNKDSKGAMVYGNELKDEYITTNPEFVKYLTDISSLLLYDEPRKSVYGFLLDPIEKTKLIDEIFKLIKIDSGKSEYSVFDKLLSSTEQNLNLAREKSTHASCLLFDLTEDFLQI